MCVWVCMCEVSVERVVLTRLATRFTLGSGGAAGAFLTLTSIHTRHARCEELFSSSPRGCIGTPRALHPPIDMPEAGPPVCPKSDSAVRQAVKPGAIVVPLGRSAVTTADAIRNALAHRAKPGTDWEESRVLHLILVVECTATGECCEAAQKFMRQLRASDGYATYAAIIGRKVSVVGLGKLGRTGGAAKVEEVCLRRGGCTRLAPIGRAEVGALSAPWLNDVIKALDADASDGTPESDPASSSSAQPAAVAAQPAAPPVEAGAKAPSPASEHPATPCGEARDSPRIISPTAALVVVALAVTGVLVLARLRGR